MPKYSRQLAVTSSTFQSTPRPVPAQTPDHPVQKVRAESRNRERSAAAKPPWRIKRAAAPRARNGRAEEQRDLEYVASVHPAFGIALFVSVSQDDHSE
ncbi:MAG: hypothetical protein HY661_21180 [Betaproteobacteria bacterium]|nr:hypothetical protein [Betaproteobacteria bacterium]